MTTRWTIWAWSTLAAVQALIAVAELARQDWSDAATALCFCGLNLYIASLLYSRRTLEQTPIWRAITDAHAKGYRQGSADATRIYGKRDAA